jgi:nicotinamidase-related amidase
MGRALLVIDMQNICVGKNHAKFFKYDKDMIVSAVNKRIAEYESENVLYICMVMKNNFINKFAPVKAFSGSYEAQIAEDVNVVSNNIIMKYKGDAFSNTELKKTLTEKNITEIECVGLDGGGCVSLTAFGALKNNYKVFINESAIDTMFVKKAKKYKKKLISQGVEFIQSKL